MANDQLTREEWKRRFAVHFKQQTGLDSDEIAESAAEGEEITARYLGKEPVWEDPEWAADEELSYWGDDDGE